ncbi:galactosylceramide sulfotransferase-like [Patiria miniata]|uniref:Galactosylceramide sulfotransferase-like n=1 Tax=Patiria miniata TaxID=46514 RepID=A0A914A808_PATMI|nr:galactosylceramide sulfotransferase-like [Patiria miniata]
MGWSARRWWRMTTAACLVVVIGLMSIEVGMLVKQRSTKNPVRPVTTTRINEWTRQKLQHVEPKQGTDTMSAPNPCQPNHRFVFIKIHKTGSSTIATMLQRYGYRRDLTFALPSGAAHSFPMSNQRYRFDTPQLVFQWNLTDRSGALVWPALGGYQVLVNHAPYNRTVDEILIPNAVYFTMIREPLARTESFFRYFLFDQAVPHKANEDPLEVFMRDPQRHTQKLSNNKWTKYFRNGQFFSLGLEREDYKNLRAVEAAIDSLSRGMDLVMLNEYFDESLLLLKKLMCWDFQDIVYISKAVRRPSGNHTSIPAGLRDQILRWNAADLRLYQHFNRTFWTKVQKYGPEFGHDLDTFRAMKESATQACMATGSRQWDWHNSSYWKLPPNASEKCRDYTRDDKAWVMLIRSRMRTKSSAFIKYRNG